MKQDNIKILITGACGQIGTELTSALRQQYGRENVIATDIHIITEQLLSDGPYERLDVLDKHELEKLVSKYKVTQIYHLVAMLSAKGDQTPALAWHVNMQSLLNVLEAAKLYEVRKIFWPSSIAVFGPTAPKKRCPQNSVCDPTTIYGISKAAGEQLCAWYGKQYGLDIRSLRYPGLISYSALPGGGTTDYAVSIFHEALRDGKYTSYLGEDSRLPMLYLDDAVKAALQLMDAPKEHLRYTAYNIGGMDFTPAEIAQEIRKHLPNFRMNYAPDWRQTIADSWPDSIGDHSAREDWGWKPTYNLSDVTADMLQHLNQSYSYP